MQWAQIRHDLFVKVTRQEPKRLARFDGWAGENNAGNAPCAQRGQCHSDRQIRLAGAGRADAENYVVAPNRIQVLLLPDGFGGDARLPFRSLDAVGQEVLERRDAFMFDNVERMGELTIADRRARLQ